MGFMTLDFRFSRDFYFPTTVVCHVRRGVRGSHPRYKSRFRLEQGFYPRYDPRMACVQNGVGAWVCIEHNKQPGVVPGV